MDVSPQFRSFFAEAKRRSDRLTNIFLASYFAVGLYLATYYDTWVIAIGVGGMALLAYYATKWLLPHSTLYQYVLGGTVGVFMAQFIYQMHGLFEMHFFAFIGSAILITYQNWRLQIPLTLLVVVHHATFGYLQFMGAPNVFFTELDYMSLQTFIIHAVLAAVIFFLCGLWAYSFKKASISQIEQSFRIGQLQEENKQKGMMLKVTQDLHTSLAVNKGMTDSIQYTLGLQRALVPDPVLLRDHFEDVFVFNKPQHIVGGDFAWYQAVGDELLLACVDCTGHGVPGAFMSIVANDLINKVVREHPMAAPSEMLQLLDVELNRAIGLEKKAGVLDGMDVIFCRIDLARKRIRFAGAMHSVILASAAGVHVHRGSNYGLGGYMELKEKSFTTCELPFEEGDMLYLFTDGYVHQFGGPQDRKLKTSGLVDVVKAVHTASLPEQGALIAEYFHMWKGTRPQTDDALVIGVKLRAAASSAAKAA
jgi:serine phosphatase RsbU (regulator of sigma subunit)